MITKNVEIFQQGIDLHIPMVFMWIVMPYLLTFGLHQNFQSNIKKECLPEFIEVTFLN